MITRVATVLLVLATIAGCGGRFHAALPRPTYPLAATPEDAIVPPPDAAPAPRALPLARAEITLANGMRVVVVERHELPVVALTFASRASGRDDADATRGIDLLLARVMYEDAIRLAPAIEGVARPITEVLSLGALVSCEVDTRWTAHALGGIAGLVRTPQFLEEVVTRERRALDREITPELDSLSTRQERHLDEMMYGAADPRSLPWWGRRAAFRHLDADDLSARHAALFAPSESVLVIVGDVDTAQIQSAARQMFEDWSHPARPMRWLPPPRFPDPAARLHGLPVSGHESSLRVREHVPPVDHPDRPGFEILTALLGGMFGSRINLTLREELGHTYGVRAAIHDLRDHSILEIDLAVAGSTTRSTIFALINEMRRLRDPAQIEPEELERGRAHAVARLRSLVATRSGLARTLAVSFLHHAPFDALATRIAAVESIDRAEVARIAGEWLRADHAPMVVIGEWTYLHYSMSFIPGGYDYIEPE